ncbi:hypothetical protein D3C86_1887050 [compost metagenome]
MQEEVGETAGGARRGGRVIGDTLGVERSRIDIHSLARLHEVDHHQSQHQGEGRENLKIDQRAYADSPKLFHVLHLGDAEHHSGEDDGREDHLD